MGTLPTTRYLAHCTDLDQLTKEWKRLAMVHHPDRGGDLAVMQQLNAEHHHRKTLLEAVGAGRVYTCPRGGGQWDVSEAVRRHYENSERTRQWREWAVAEEEKARERAAQWVKQRQAEKERQKQQHREDLDLVYKVILRWINWGRMPGVRAWKDTIDNTVYVAGPTYPYKEELKKCGMWWDGQNRRWYFKELDTQKRMFLEAWWYDNEHRTREEYEEILNFKE